MSFIASITLPGLLVRRAGRGHFLDEPTLIPWDRVRFNQASIGVVDELGRKLHSVSLRSRQTIVARRAQHRWYLQSLGRRPFQIGQPPMWGLSKFFVAQFAFALFVALGSLGWVITRAWNTSQQPDFALLPWAPKAGLAFIALLMACGCLAYAGFAAVMLRQSYGPRRVREYTIDEHGLTVVLPGGSERFLWRDLRSSTRRFSVQRLTLAAGTYIDIPAQFPANVYIRLIASRWYGTQSGSSLRPLLRRRGGIPIAAMLVFCTVIAIGLPAPEHMTKLEHSSFAIAIAVVGAVILALIDFNDTGELRRCHEWDVKFNRRVRFWWRRRRARTVESRPFLR